MRRNSKDGVTRIPVPSEAGRILLGVPASASDADIGTVITKAIMLNPTELAERGGIKMVPKCPTVLADGGSLLARR